MNEEELSALLQHEALAAEEAEFTCHCGESVTFGFDGNPRRHRGMCEHCDPIRCDAYPGECGR